MGSYVQATSKERGVLSGHVSRARVCVWPHRVVRVVRVGARIRFAACQPCAASCRVVPSTLPCQRLRGHHFPQCSHVLPSARLGPGGPPPTGAERCHPGAQHREPVCQAGHPRAPLAHGAAAGAQGSCVGVLDTGFAYFGVCCWLQQRPTCSSSRSYGRARCVVALCMTVYARDE